MFDGVDQSELTAALFKLDNLELDLDEEDTFPAAYQQPKYLYMWVNYLEAHIAHLEAHPISNHTDYIPVYKHLRTLAEDEHAITEYFSFFQLYGVMFPLMWC